MPSCTSSSPLEAALLSAPAANSAPYAEVTRKESQVLASYIQRTAILLDAGRRYGDN